MTKTQMFSLPVRRFYPSARHSFLQYPVLLIFQPRLLGVVHSLHNHIVHLNNLAWQKKHFVAPIIHPPWFLSLPDTGLWRLATRHWMNPLPLYAPVIWPDRFPPAYRTFSHRYWLYELRHRAELHFFSHSPQLSEWIFACVHRYTHSSSSPHQSGQTDHQSRGHFVEIAWHSHKYPPPQFVDIKRPVQRVSGLLHNAVVYALAEWKDFGLVLKRSMPPSRQDRVFEIESRL